MREERQGILQGPCKYSQVFYIKGNKKPPKRIRQRSNIHQFMLLKNLVSYYVENILEKKVVATC